MELLGRFIIIVIIGALAGGSMSQIRAKRETQWSFATYAFGIKIRPVPRVETPC